MTNRVCYALRKTLIGLVRSKKITRTEYLALRRRSRNGQPILGIVKVLTSRKARPPSHDALSRVAKWSSDL